MQWVDEGRKYYKNAGPIYQNRHEGAVLNVTGFSLCTIHDDVYFSRNKKLTLVATVNLVATIQAL